MTGAGPRGDAPAMIDALAPLWAAGWMVASHAVAALAALALAVVQFAGPKGSATHRVLGWVWTGLMLWTAVGSFWIHSFRVAGPFSPIHLLSVVVIATAPLAALQGRRGRVEAHRRGMTALVLSALVLAGLFTLAPGRVMHRVVFGAG